jgi:hypothetical protein
MVRLIHSSSTPHEFIHGQLNHGQFIHGQFIHGQLIHGQFIHGQIHSWPDSFMVN